MCFVDDDRELPAALLVADFVQDEWELLDRRDDDLLPLSMNLRRSPSARHGPTVAPTWANCLMVSRICLSRMRRSVTTMIESNRGVVFLQANELMREPGDGVGFAATGGVLNQVTLAGALLFDVGEQPAHDVELVVPRPDLDGLLLAGFVVLRLDDLRVVLEDVGEARHG